ncbi:MAG: hypothetical protein IT579_16540 [Verrucomicrobia subdivision 3 bacterium]|nr:hypothetical protein [Limisphaerales bacterium]
MSILLPILLLSAAVIAQGGSSVPEAERLAVVATRVEAGCRQVEAGLANPNPQPSVRQLTSAALGWLELGQPPERAEKLVRHAFGLQDMDPASPGYGTVPWQQGRPEIKDANAIEFTMQPVSALLLRHGDKLSAAFKQDAPPHVRAAITAIRRHNVPLKYSNIYLMKLANLLLLGQAIGDGEAVAEGKANFEMWLTFTRTNGVTEYDSPTYSPIQADCLALAHNLTSDPALKARLKAALDFYWADFAANYFPGRQTMTGPASRNYNQGFLFSDANIEYHYYLAGLRSKPPADTFLSDSVRAWTAARMNGYRPSPEILALADLPDRTVRSKFGAGPGQDRYVWITPAFSLGSASAYHGPQDRRICAEPASDKQLPLISFVVDALDAPFGLVRATDRGGHSKPHHLPHLLATVQEKGFLLALMDLSPAISDGEFTNLASNVLLPVKVDQLVLNGIPVDSTKPFDLAADADSVVGLREGKAAVAVRLFAADGAAGYAPTWKLEFDGNEQGAGRLAVYHYRGPARKLAEKRPRCGLVMLAARCETDAALAAFLKRAAQIELTETTQAGVWQVKAKLEASELEAGLDLEQKQIALRRVNGRAWRSEVLSVNDRDLARETLRDATGGK